MSLTAVEDFKKRSLRSLPTLLEKLAYICSLQAEDGSYQHWGLTQTFGYRLAQDAILRAHTETSMELIRVPLRELYQEYQQAINKAEGPQVLSVESLVLKAPVSGDELLSAHLRLLQNSVEAVAHQERTSPQDA
jgi:hypothetical protein